MLFPLSQHKANKNYLKSIPYEGNLEGGHEYSFDPPLEPLKPDLCLNNFHVWQDWLSKVYFMFIGPPTSELERFRKDFKGWLGFWGTVVGIAVMTFMFGVLSIIIAIKA